METSLLLHLYRDEIEWIYDLDARNFGISEELLPATIREYGYRAFAKALGLEVELEEGSTRSWHKKTARRRLLRIWLLEAQQYTVHFDGRLMAAQTAVQPAGGYHDGSLLTRRAAGCAITKAGDTP